jgi:hypothetical protein
MHELRVLFSAAKSFIKNSWSWSDEAEMHSFACCSTHTIMKRTMENIVCVSEWEKSFNLAWIFNSLFVHEKF